MSELTPPSGTKMQFVYVIIACITIPASTAITNYYLTKQSLNKEYVQIALKILTPEKEESPEQKKTMKTLAPWAVELLKKSAPVALTDEQCVALESRTASLQDKPLLLPVPPTVTDSDSRSRDVPFNPFTDPNLTTHPEKERPVLSPISPALDPTDKGDFPYLPKKPVD